MMSVIWLHCICVISFIFIVEWRSHPVWNLTILWASVRLLNRYYSYYWNIVMCARQHSMPLHIALLRPRYVSIYRMQIESGIEMWKKNLQFHFPLCRSCFVFFYSLHLWSMILLRFSFPSVILFNIMLHFVKTENKREKNKPLSPHIVH